MDIIPLLGMGTAFIVAAAAVVIMLDSPWHPHPKPSRPYRH